MLSPSEVLRSTRPSAALANVVHEPGRFHKHKNFTYIQPFVIFRGAIGQQENSTKCKKINTLLLKVPS